MSRPSSAHRAASGASWPFSMLKQVVLPAPLGPISASISPARDGEGRRPSTACTPPKALCSAVDLQHRRAHAGRQRATRALEAADQALREDEDDQRGSRAPSTARQYSVCAGQRVAQPGEDARRRRPARPACGRRPAAPSPARRSIARCEHRRARCCPWRRRRARRPGPANVPASDEGGPLQARTSMPIASARSGESRPARSA